MLNLTFDIGSVTPGAFDHACWHRADLRADLPQHVTEILCFKAGRADHSFTLDLHMTNQVCVIYNLCKRLFYVKILNNQLSVVMLLYLTLVQ